MSDLKARITDDMKAAMRSKEKDRLKTIRSILAAIQLQEVDSQAEIEDDTAVLLILDKLVKQRRDSFTQYSDAGRDDLAVIEEQEMAIIQEYLPTQLSDDEINTLIQQAMEQSGASSMQDMGKVMGILKPQAQGRADMGKISGLIKQKLG